MIDWNKNAMDYTPEELALDQAYTTRLFQSGNFTSHAGLELNWKIECDAISDSEWDCLAQMIMDYQKRPFYRALGIPRGGLKLAEALNKYGTDDTYINSVGDIVHRPYLICDDVATTGKSFQEFINEKFELFRGPYPEVYKWVIFARKPFEDINALFTMPEIS